jgi:hypothetical protein
MHIMKAVKGLLAVVLSVFLGGATVAVAQRVQRAKNLVPYRVVITDPVPLPGQRVDENWVDSAVLTDSFNELDALGYIPLMFTVMADRVVIVCRRP